MDKNIPRLGFGTYGRNGPEGVEAILAALETGYRHLDTAQTYDTEREVGQAVSRSGLDRQEVFVTTKISTENYGEGALLPSLRQSLDQLQLDQVDLTLLHWPAPNGSVPLAQYLGQLVEAKEAGLTRLIGVSNFTIGLIEEAQRLVGKGRLATNQFELHPYLQNRKLADYCQREDILVTCYLPIAHGTLAGDLVLEQIAASHGATVAQVALAFERSKGYASIPTSSKPDRIRENFASQKVELSKEEMARIEMLDRNGRRINPDWGPAWD
ncbi:aldo/keto reductase [Devosia sp. YIM 151766]|nr:aldo/keto reductase [Devosia sp. YIM 151766]WIY54543.1 aldo/keto reductase [Devosia sp. YIM 151766]